MERRSIIVRANSIIFGLGLFSLMIANFSQVAFGQNSDEIVQIVNNIQRGYFEIAENHAAAYVGRYPAKPDGYAYLGFAGYIVGRDAASAQKNLEKATQLEPNNGLFAAMFSMASSDPDLSKQQAEKAIRLLYQPKTAMEFFARGRAYLTIGKPADAFDDITEAIRLEPNFAFAYSWRSRIYADKKENAQAISDLEKAIRINTKYLGLNERVGDLYLNSGEALNALYAYSRALEISPESAGLYHNRGVANRRAGKQFDSYKDYTKAIELYSKDLTKYPDSAAATYLNRGICYANKSDYVSAAKDFSSAINIKPDVADGYFKRADAYERLGKMDLAKADRRKYTEKGGQEKTPQPANNLFPDMLFDGEQAKQALGRGFSSISGIVCTQYRGSVYRAGGTEVFLYPVTPYLDAWYKLREKRENNKKGFWVYMADDAFYTKSSVVTNDQGRFVFSDLKPGRYFLQAFHEFSSGHSGTEIVAQDEDTDYYQNYRYSVPHSNRLEKFTDLKAEEDVKITMKTGKAILDLKGCL